MASGFQAVFATKTQMWSLDTNMDPSAAILLPIVQSKRDGEANEEYRISDLYQKWRESAKNVVFKLSRPRSSEKLPTSQTQYFGYIIIT